MKNLTILIALFGLSISSCSVVKRKYTSGYSVHWKKEFSTNKNSLLEEKKDVEKVSFEIKTPTENKSDQQEFAEFEKNHFDICDTIIPENDQTVAEKKEDDLLKENDQKNAHLNGIGKRKIIHPIFKIIYNKNKNDQEIPEENENKTEPFGVIGFLFLILGGFLFLVAYSSSAYGSVSIFALTILFLAILAGLFGVISLGRLCRKNNTFSKRSWFFAVMSLLSSLLLFAIAFITAMIDF